MKVEVKSGILNINNKIVTFKFEVAQFIQLDKLIIVRLKVPVDIIFNENVFGLNEEAKIIWQIEHKDFIHKNSPYTNIRLLDNGQIRLSNWDGTQLIVEPLTGDIIKEDWVK
jgi:hypothetical protein